MSKVIEQMIRAVRDGYTPRSVFESTLSLHPGSTARVNKDTTVALQDGGTAPIARGEVVSIVGVGGGVSGTDHFVQLSDGRKGTVPFYDLGESTLRRAKRVVREADEPAEDDGDPRIVRVELTKPLSQEAEDWLKTGYKSEDGLELPQMPEDDQPDGVSFLMKAKDQECLGKALGELKKVAAENIKKIEPASEDDWTKV